MLPNGVFNMLPVCFKFYTSSSNSCSGCSMTTQCSIQITSDSAHNFSCLNDADAKQTCIKGCIVCQRVAATYATSIGFSIVRCSWLQTSFFRSKKSHRKFQGLLGSMIGFRCCQRNLIGRRSPLQAWLRLSTSRDLLDLSLCPLVQAALGFHIC